MNITTNHHQPRPILTWDDLTPAEQKEHDYLTTDEYQQGAQFARYKGFCYYLNDFSMVQLGSPFVGWYGYWSESYSSGVCFKYTNCNDDPDVVMGRFYS